MTGEQRAVLGVAPHLEIAVVDGVGAAARSATTQQVFRGGEYALALRLLGLEHDRDGLDAALREHGTAPDAAARAIDELIAAGVLVEQVADDHTSASWAAAGVPAAAVARRLADTPVALASTGPDPGGLAQALTDAGVTVADDAAFSLVLAEDYLDDVLRDRNDVALESGEPWMLARLGTETWIGPVFEPDRGPCWECLAPRLRAHRAAGGLQGETIARPGLPLPAARAAAEAALALEVARWIVLGRASGRSERILRVNPLPWAADEHVVVRRPQCAACGIGDEPLPPVAMPVRLGSPGPAAAGLRAATPDATYDRLAHHVSPISGVVSAVVPSRGMRPPRHAYAAGPLHVRVHGRDEGGPQLSGGKGATRDEARTGALCEALERHSGAFAGDEPRRIATFDEVRPLAVHPEDLMRFSDAQYERREELNARAQSIRTFVPERLAPSTPIAWSPAWSLTADRERLLPTGFCFYSAHVAGHEACVAESNGNAAGNSLDEAILHGLLELVERDHVALWWFNRAHRPGLVLESFEDPWLDALVADLRRDGRELWALDLTADLGIPVVAALAERSDGDGVVLGLGAHVEMGRALARAASEVVQLDLGAPAGGLGAGPPPGFDDAYLRPDTGTPARTAADYARPRATDLRAELDRCIGAVEARGLEVIVLDQTRPDVGLPVAKVVVPGLRHFWPRFAPGRLYDVPVALGWMPEPLPEEDLNPTPPVL